MSVIIEWAPIRLAAGKTEKDLLAASETFQKDFLSTQPGFIKRELARKSEQDFVDIVYWRSAADAKAIMDKVQNSQACATYFSVMEMGDADLVTGVDHFTSLAVYQ